MDGRESRNHWNIVQQVKLSIWMIAMTPSFHGPRQLAVCPIIAFLHRYDNDIKVQMNNVPEANI